MPKVKNEYDENGRWVQEKNRIKGAIRRAFRLSPQMKDVLYSARVELPPALKKDGTPGKRPQVRYKCAECGELFPRKYVQVDHIEPVIPLYCTEADLSYDEMIRNIFCDVSGLQVVCSTPLKYNDGQPSCHKKKTDEENWIRRQLVAFLKGEGLSDRTDVDFKRFIEPHRQKYQEHLIEEQAKKKNGKKRQTKKRKSNT